MTQPESMDPLTAWIAETGWGAAVVGLGIAVVMWLVVVLLLRLLD